MPSITIRGLKGLSTALSEFCRVLNSELADRTITPIAQEAKARLEGDTPVVTGRLLRSTVLRKEGRGRQVLGQFAPYANVVNNRRGYWQGAIQVAEKWPPLFQRMVAQEWGVMARRHAGA